MTEHQLGTASTTYTKLPGLHGLTIKRIVGLEEGSDEVEIHTECGKAFRFWHCQDCCESVCLNDFDGDAESLIGGYISKAEEIEGETDEGRGYESYTWTFYNIETTKGQLYMRWLGESNGYYSEEVSFGEVTPS